PAKNILIDGTDIGGVNTQVIEERKALSMTGMISVVVTVNKDGIIFTKPTVISKGYLYAKDNEHIFKAIENHIIEYFKAHPVKDKNESIEALRKDLGEYIYSISKQRPAVFTIINQA
ncbi:MAG: hypothetical protein K6G38_01515, partial [Gammaproteobacteria bacterium]|nr:hypothetical protein [Gammaproteobacteria bacterium]